MLLRAVGSGDNVERSKSAVNANAHNDNYHRDDEQVNVCMECAAAEGMQSLKNRFLRLSAQATIMQLKKFVALKLYDNMHRFKDVRITSGLCCVCFAMGLAG